MDNLTWTKGSHTLGFGGNWRLIHNNRGSDANSYNTATTNPYWYTGAGPPDPSHTGVPPVSSGFGNSYQIAYGNLIGGIPRATTVSNYDVAKGGATGNLFPDGTFINRHFKANELNGTCRIAGERGRT